MVAALLQYVVGGVAVFLAVMALGWPIYFIGRICLFGPPKRMR